MSQIIISDLEVFHHVGVPDQERARPQRLLISMEMEYDFSEAAAADDLTKTIDYYSVVQRLREFGEGRSWQLIEKLAADIAEMVLAEFQPTSVTVEIKKFIIPDASHVGVRMTRTRVDSSY